MGPDPAIGCIIEAGGSEVMERPSRRSTAELGGCGEAALTAGELKAPNPMLLAAAGAAVSPIPADIPILLPAGEAAVFRPENKSTEAAGAGAGTDEEPKSANKSD